MKNDIMKKIYNQNDIIKNEILNKYQILNIII